MEEEERGAKKRVNKKNSMGRGLVEAARRKSFGTRTKTRSQINAVELNRGQGNIKPWVPRFLGGGVRGRTSESGTPKGDGGEGGFDLLHPERPVPRFESVHTHTTGIIPVVYDAKKTIRLFIGIAYGCVNATNLRVLKNENNVRLCSFCEN